MTLTKKDLQIALQEKGFSLAEAGRVIDLILSSMRQALGRGEQVHTPIGSFYRNRTGSTCITNSLEGDKRVRQFVCRRPAFHYSPDNSRESLERLMKKVHADRARGDGRIWTVVRHSGRSNDTAREVYRGTEKKATERYMKLSFALRQGSVGLHNSDGRASYSTAYAQREKDARNRARMEAIYEQERRARRIESGDP